MLGRWWRLLLVPVLACSMLMTVATAPVLGAGCTLTAPAAPVPVGTQVSIVGSGFPADIDVAVTLTNAAAAPVDLTAHSDASGAFLLSLQVDTGDVGSTSVTASAGTGCTAQAVLVVTAASTGTPAASVAPSAIASPAAAASPSGAPAAVVSSPAGSKSTMRPLAATNAAPQPPSEGSSLPSMLILLGLVVLAIGVAGWLGIRSVGSSE